MTPTLKETLCKSLSGFNRTAVFVTLGIRLKCHVTFENVTSGLTVTGSQSCSSKTRVTRTYFEWFNLICLYTWRNPRVRYVSSETYLQQKTAGAYSGQVGMYLTQTQNLYQSRYNSFPEFKWPHTAAESTSITLTAHAKKALDAKERYHQNELYCISASASSFTTDYSRFLPPITSLKLRRLHRCLCSRCGTTNERLAGLQLCT